VGGSDAGALVGSSVTAEGVAGGAAFCSQAESKKIKSKLEQKIFFITVSLNSHKAGLAVSRQPPPLVLKHHHLTLGLLDRVAGNLLFERLTRQDRDIRQGAQ
jgi:hypothetical protein